MKTKTTVFYSWQSDRSNKTNRGLIQSCLKRAIRGISRDKSFAIDPCLDRDTQDKPGAPHIAETILSKVESASAFVADVTIMPTPPDTKRPSPNPNVMMELGYAVNRLGWERVILIANTAYGEVESLPFDIRHRSILKYSATTSSDLPACRKDLQNRLQKGLSRILMIPRTDEPALVLCGGVTEIPIREPSAMDQSEETPEWASRTVCLPLDLLGSDSQTLSDVDCFLTVPKGAVPYDRDRLKAHWKWDRAESTEAAISQMFQRRDVWKEIGTMFDFESVLCKTQRPISRRTTPFESPQPAQVSVNGQRIRFHVKKLKKGLTQPLPDIFIILPSGSPKKLELEYRISSDKLSRDGVLTLQSTAVKPSTDQEEPK